MTTVELAIRLLRDLDVDDLTLLSAGGRLDMVTAMNTGLQKHHALSPDHLKTTQASVTLKAPESVSLDVTNGLSTFTGWTPTAAQLYSTLRIDGDDDLDHRVISTTDLLDDYLGTTGTKAATLYHDSISFYQPIEKIVSNPKIDVGGGEIFHKHDSNWWDTFRTQRKRIGTPRFFCIEENAVNNGSDSVFSMRFDTMPDKNYRLRFDIQMSPQKVTFNDLVTPANLPVRDDHVESVLLPLCRKALFKSKLWRDKTTRAEVDDEALESSRSFELLAVTHIAPKGNRVGTPEGY
tara:strand:- start:9175 stop:10050 length:876 start_codon:yes stop_codon:yes gene_type:complete